MKKYKEHWWLKLRRFAVDGELSAHILRLSKSSGTSSQTGLIMIQIDGLSRTELEKAFNRQETPFLRKLIKNEQYTLRHLYTGVPSTTPAVQGELFYGVKHIVPAFYYFDRTANRPFKMLEWKSVEEIERRLQKQGKGLLEGGSSYSNIYSGGAQETHFCAVSLGLSKIWRKVNPFRLILLILIHLVTFIRMICLAGWEILLGLIGFLKGVWKKENPWIEFKFIFLRVSICVILRELITLGARIDIARGLPIIHLNFFGYDEHAHHRGPSSIDAHKALRGIDRAIEIIYKSALHSSRRQYDVWIYSDHGQDDVASYQAVYGSTVSKMVKKIYADFQSGKSLETGLDRLDSNSSEDVGVQFTRARYLGSWFEKLSIIKKEDLSIFKNSDVFVSAIGPTGQVYLKNQLTLAEKRKLAQHFVHQGHVPIVMLPEENRKVRAWNKEGEFILPENASQVFGSQHPYLKEISTDMIELCRHEHAGDFTLCGWVPDGKPISFPLEYGAHAGPGTGETDALAILPSDILSSSKNKACLTTKDLRKAALKLLNRADEAEKIYAHSASHKIIHSKTTIRLMTYNVHSCIGIDGKLSFERIARVIARHEPDIVALQELESGCQRTHTMDQPHLIAKQLEMLYHFHPAIDIEEERYGNAILSRYPIDYVAAQKLPALMNKYHHEPRGALWVSVKINNFTLNIITTHLGLNQLEACQQARNLVSEDWLTHPQCRGPVILCGDFNSTPRSACWKILNRKLKDAQLKIHPKKHKSTWFSRFPVRSIDHVFVSPDIEIVRIQVSRTHLDQQASDHLPLIVDFKISGK